jgi:hypothetical protein
MRAAWELDFDLTYTRLTQTTPPRGPARVTRKVES